jgi:O-antigen/teichoic acid export membrane protein
MGAEWDVAPGELGISPDVDAYNAPFDDDGEPLDSLVMESRDRLANIGLFVAGSVVFGLALLVATTRDPAIDQSAGWIGAILLGLSFGLFGAMLFWLGVFARHRRIAYRGDWARAIRRGGWIFLVTALFVILRLNKVFSWEIGLFILALVAVAEATLSVER